MPSFKFIKYYKIAFDTIENVKRQTNRAYHMEMIGNCLLGARVKYHCERESERANVLLNNDCVQVLESDFE